jgi:hypothetical protein
VARTFVRTTTAAELWWREPIAAWLDRGEIPADCLTDLKTKDNTLSVYEVASEADQLRVATALALQRAIGGKKQRQSLSDIAAMVFEEQLLGTLGIEVKAIHGKTTDDTVNKWHFDMVALSGRQLANLALELVKQTQPKTFTHKQMLKELDERAKAGHIKSESIPERVHEQMSEI